VCRRVVAASDDASFLCSGADQGKLPRAFPVAEKGARREEIGKTSPNRAKATSSDPFYTLPFRNESAVERHPHLQHGADFELRRDPLKSLLARIDRDNHVPLQIELPFIPASLLLERIMRR
jgi:hypothetical protein